MFTYNFGTYHEKYMAPVRRLLGASEINKFILPSDSIIVTNSVFSCDGKTYSHPIKMSALGNIVISLGHSLVMQNDHYMDCQTELKCYNLFPNFRGGTYFGHYMTLFHYENIPIHDQDESLLVLVQPQTRISQIRSLLLQIPIKMRVRLHPGIKENKNDIPQHRIAHKYEEWLKLQEVGGVEIIDNDNETICDSIDKSKFVFGAFPSSTVIEAGIRGAIYNREKFLCYNGTSEQIPMTIGIPNNVCPRLENFKRMNSFGISRYVIGLENQQDSLYNSLMNLIGAIKCK